MENTQTKQEINNQIIKNLIKIIVINSTSSQELNKMQEDLQKSCEVLKDFKKNRGGDKSVWKDDDVAEYDNMKTFISYKIECREDIREMRQIVKSYRSNSKDKNYLEKMINDCGDEFLTKIAKNGYVCHKLFEAVFDFLKLPHKNFQDYNQKIQDICNSSIGRAIEQAPELFTIQKTFSGRFDYDKDILIYLKKNATEKIKSKLDFFFEEDKTLLDFLKQEKEPSKNVDFISFIQLIKLLNISNNKQI